MKRTWTKAAGGFLVLGLIMAGGALAAQEPQGRNYGPPQEAIQACEGMTEGDTVSVETPRGDAITATCRQMRGALVAVPEDAPGPPRGRGRDFGPPPEAIEACEGMDEGDAVTFETPRGESVSGICKQKGEQLVAVPEGDSPPRQHGRGMGPRQ